jgi:hypothetical protein
LRFEVHRLSYKQVTKKSGYVTQGELVNKGTWSHGITGWRHDAPPKCRYAPKNYMESQPRRTKLPPLKPENFLPYIISPEKKPG